MKPLLAVLPVVALLVGCETPSDPRFWYDHSIPEREGRRAYRVEVEVSDPGCHIEVNDEHVATFTNTVGEIVLWGDKDGMFRGNDIWIVVANPVKPGQNQQRKVFGNGRGPRTPVPHRIYFDLKLERVKPTEKIDFKVQ